MAKLNDKQKTTFKLWDKIHIGSIAAGRLWLEEQRQLARATTPPDTNSTPHTLRYFEKQIEKANKKRVLPKKQRTPKAAAMLDHIIKRELYFDKLTGLLNYRGFNDMLLLEILNRHERKQKHEKLGEQIPHTSLLFMDMNYFKDLNTHLDMGRTDLIVTEVGDLIKKSLRTRKTDADTAQPAAPTRRQSDQPGTFSETEEDEVGRRAGDEFMGCMFGCDGDKAKKKAEQLLEDVRKKVFIIKNSDYVSEMEGKPGQVTYSVVYDLSLAYGYHQLDNDRYIEKGDFDMPDEALVKAETRMKNRKEVWKLKGDIQPPVIHKALTKKECDDLKAQLGNPQNDEIAKNWFDNEGYKEIEKLEDLILHPPYSSSAFDAASSANGALKYFHCPAVQYDFRNPRRDRAYMEPLYLQWAKDMREAINTEFIEKLPEEIRGKVKILLPPTAPENMSEVWKWLDALRDIRYSDIKDNSGKTLRELWKINGLPELPKNNLIGLKPITRTKDDIIHIDSTQPKREHPDPVLPKAFIGR